VPKSLRPCYDLSPLCGNLLRINRRLAHAFPKTSIHINWTVDKKPFVSLEDALGRYHHNMRTEGKEVRRFITPGSTGEYEEFTLLGQTFVKSSPYIPDVDCGPEIDQKIINITAKRLGLRVRSFRNRTAIVMCGGGHLSLFLELELPIDKVPPPFIEKNLVPKADSFFKDLTDLALKEGLNVDRIMSVPIETREK
jgi:hypothetical protein